MSTATLENELSFNVMGHGDFCHIVAAPPKHSFGDTALCGYVPHEGSCCADGFPNCGRPRCPECKYIWKTEWQRV